MNPLLPESVNPLGRNASFTAKSGSAKSGMKTDSADNTGVQDSRFQDSRFHDTLKANTPQKQKRGATAGDSTEKPQEATPEQKSIAVEAEIVKSTSGEATANTGTEVTETSAQVPEGGELNFAVETILVNTDTPVAQPVLAARGLDATPQASPGLEIKPEVKVSDTARSLLQPAPMVAITGVADDGTDVAGPRLLTELSPQPDNSALLPVPRSGAGGDPLTAPLFTASHSVRVIAPAISADTASEQAAPVSTVTVARALSVGAVAAGIPVAPEGNMEKPLDPNLTLAANGNNASVDKRTLPPHTTGADLMQPVYVKSNLDWRFANQTLATESSLFIESASTASASTANSTPIATSGYAALSAMAPTPFEVVDHRVQMPVNIKFGLPEWAGMVAERTAMMASQKISFAELQLDPPELGPLQVRVTVNHDQASVNFVSASPAVRDSLEQTAVRLRDMLDQQGLDLVDVNVSDQSAQQYSREQGEDPRRSTSGVEDDPTGDDPVRQVMVSASGIDHYV